MTAKGVLIGLAIFVLVVILVAMVLVFLGVVWPRETFFGPIKFN